MANIRKHMNEYMRCLFVGKKKRCSVTLLNIWTALSTKAARQAILTLIPLVNFQNQQSSDLQLSELVIDNFLLCFYPESLRLEIVLYLNKIINLKCQITNLHLLRMPLHTHCNLTHANYNYYIQATSHLCDVAVADL